MKTAKRVLGIVADVLIVMIFVVSIFVIISNASQKKTGVPSIFGYTFAAVQSDSMTGTFEKGDMVVGKKVNENTQIKEGDIISFFQIVDNKKIINTHRVVEVVNMGEYSWYYTKGDKPGVDVDTDAKTLDQIVAVYQFKISGLGNFFDFLREPLGFILIIVLPIVLVIIWQAYRLVVLYTEGKKAEIIKEAQSAEPTEEMKQAIIDEYLKSMNKKSDGE